MEIKGKIIQVLPEQGGIGKASGKEWKLQSYVLETLEQFPRKVNFELFGEDRIKANPCQLGDVVTVSFDLESREFNGRWYTSVRAWRVDKDTDEQKEVEKPINTDEGVDILASMPDAYSLRSTDEVEENNDLPF